jgi:hypothetical protein
VLDAQLLDNLNRHDARGKGAPEHGAKLVVQPTDAHVLKFPVRIDDGALAKGVKGGASYTAELFEET